MDKNTIRALCAQKIQAQMSALQELLDDVQHASNQETKSTAGDKHDTARAQAQLEVERLGKQLLITEKYYEDVQRLSTEQHDKVRLGSFVVTEQGNFYVSIGLGKIDCESYSFYAISPASPLGKILIGKSVGDLFVMINGQKNRILKLL